MTDTDIILFAKTNFRGKELRFGIKREDRRRHTYLIGKTGMGKSQVLENMAIQDIRNGHGLAVVDPHGDMIEKLLEFIPPERVNDVVYFNPADLDYPIAFNVLEKVSQAQRHLVASGLIGVFKKIWADSWGPRLEYVLHNAISALLEYPGSTLLGIMRMLTDKTFRKRVINNITDPMVRAFWVEEYSKYPDRFQAEAIAPIQNKVGRFLASSVMRNIVGQVESSISVRDIMDSGKIFLINLSKGRVGEDNSNLLGALMITKMQLAAMSRVDTPEESRRDFYLYVDEFQNFATESFADILSEARKYRLNLILAHQYIAQLIGDNNTRVRDAVFGNVGTIITFRVGAADAEFLEMEFTPTFTQEDLVNLPKWQIYLKLMIDGVTSDAFSANTLEPFQSGEDAKKQAQKIIRVSRERYAKPREMIEEKIMRWSKPILEEQNSPSTTTTITPSSKYKGTAQRKPKTKNTLISNKNINESQCTNCGIQTTTNFKPDPNRPVFCPDCLKLARSGKLPTELSIDTAKTIPQEVSLSDILPIKTHTKNEPTQATEVREAEISSPRISSTSTGHTTRLAPGTVVTFPPRDNS